MDYIPHRLILGSVRREDAQSGLLAFIGYYDNNGKAHKEDTIKSWVKKEHGSIQETENVPFTNPLVLKIVGNERDSMNPRKAWVRLLHPAGFDFEVTVNNFLELLKDSVCINGVLTGSYVYAFDDNGILVLLTVGSQRHSIALQGMAALSKPFNLKDLRPGYTYKMKTGKDLIYMGYGDVDSSIGFLILKEKRSRGQNVSLSGKLYYFYDPDNYFAKNACLSTTNFSYGLLGFKKPTVLFETGKSETLYNTITDFIRQW